MNLALNVTSQRDSSTVSDEDIDMKDNLNHKPIQETSITSTTTFRTAIFDHVKYNSKTKQNTKGKIKIFYTIKEDPDKNVMRYWFEGDQNQTRVNKTWIRTERIKLIKAIMTRIMLIPEQIMNSMNTNQKREYFASELGLKLVLEQETDDSIMEMVDVVKELHHRKDMSSSLVMDDVTIDEYFGNNLFVKILFSLNDIAIFRSFAASIWDLLCDAFLKFQSFKKWDDFVIDLLYRWSYADFWKQCFSKQFYAIHTAIEGLKRNLFHGWKYEDHFQGFISSFIIRVHDIFIKESRNIIIRNLLAVWNVDKHTVNKYQSISFGGAGINSVFKQILNGPYSAQKDTLLPYANILVHPAFDIEDIPSRLIKENRGYMRIMNPVMIPFAADILGQLKSDVMFSKRVSNHVDLKEIRERIIKSKDNEDQFYHSFESIVQKSDKASSFHMNVTILDVIYNLFCKGVLSKATWSILSKATYKEDCVPLRQMQKGNNIMNKNQRIQKLPFGN
eukprot:149914_1